MAAAHATDIAEMLTTLGKQFGFVLIILGWVADRVWLLRKARKKRKETAEMVRQMQEMTDSTAQLHKKLTQE